MPSNMSHENYIVVVALLFLTPSGTEGFVTLNSPMSDHLCPRDRLMYTCSTSGGTLRWNVREAKYTYIFSRDYVNKSMTDPNLPGVITVLTAKDVNEKMLTSTLTIRSAGDDVANESTISCTDINRAVDSSVLHIIGSPSAPGINVAEDVAAGNVTVHLTPPVYGKECLSEYIVEYDDSSKTIGTNTSTVISNLDLCFQEYNFSAFGVTHGVPNGTRSISVNRGHVPNPEMISVSASQDLCPNRNPNTVSLMWNPPTEFQECISGYTLETTTARGTQNASVTSNTASVSVRCCLRYNFTVYTRSPTGQMTTSNIPLSFVSGQSDYPDPGNLQLTVMYGSTIALTVHWQNAGALHDFEKYMIVTCVDNNPHEKVIQRGRLTAPTNAKFLTLDYATYIDCCVPVNVTFSTDDCTGSSSQLVTFPPIISDHGVETGDENATITVTFATNLSVTFDVVSTAIVETNVTATEENADHIRQISMFPPDVTTIEVNFTNLTQDTEYNYTVRVLTSSNYLTAVVIPYVAEGTFTITAMTTQADIVRVIGISVSPALAVLLVIIVMVMAFLLWKKVSNRRKSRRPKPLPEQLTAL